MNKTDIQNDFLDRLKNERCRVTVITINGFQIKGQITSHGRYTIHIDVGGKQYMVYKHAVSTVVQEEN